MQPDYLSLVPSQNMPPRPPVGVHHRPWEHTALKTLSWGAVATAGLALAPFVFSRFSPNAVLASSNAIDACTTGGVKGLVGSIYNAFENTIGTGLISGGWPTVLASAGLALGGLWLANVVDKHTKQGEFRWGSVIRWAALGTSILISLPTILTAVSMGINFFGFWAESDALRSIGGAIGSLGAKAVATGAGTVASAAGLAGLHALTCALPLGITGFFLGQKEEKPMPKLQLPAHGDGRVMLPPTMQRATAL